MQPFHFRLDRVLHWQRRTWHGEKDKLEQLAAALLETRGRQAQLVARSARTEREFLEEPHIAPADLKALAEFRRQQQVEEARMGREMNDRQAAVARQRERLVAERRKLEALEKLRARAWSEYQMELDKELEALALESHMAARFR
jgi:hypothetical protein